MLFRNEFYKICSRKILFTGVLLGFLFLAAYFQMSALGSESAYVDGTCLRRTDAIQYNRETARRFAGPMTREKAQAIVDEFGWHINENELEMSETGDTTPGYYDNSTSRFVTYHLSNSRSNGGTPTALASSENKYTTEMMNGEYEYGYIGGWDDTFREMHMMLLWIVSALVIIACAPVFSEEYAGQTAGILLTTQNGKDKTAAAKILAAFTWAAGIYVLLTLFLVGAFLCFYGTEGLFVSAGLSFPDLITGSVLWNTDSHKPTGIVLLLYLLAGLLSVLVTAAITLFISSVKKSTFSALLWSAAAYLLPAAIYSVFLLGMRVSKVIMLLRLLFNSLPFFLPLHELTSTPVLYRLFGYLFSGCILVSGCVLGCRKYCRYQVGK